MAPSAVILTPAPPAPSPILTKSLKSSSYYSQTTTTTTPPINGSLKSYPPLPPIYSHLLSLAPVAAPFIPASEVTAYPVAVQSLLPTLSSLDEKLQQMLPPGSQNWTHDFLTALLLSERRTLATDKKLSFLMSASDVGSREEMAARLLWAVAHWRRNGYRGGRKSEVGWQVDGLLASFCEPGQEMDRVRLAEVEMGGNVVVWAGGRAWQVALFDGEEERSVDELQRELEIITIAAENKTIPNPSIAALSHRLPRAEWARAKAALGSGDGMARLGSSLITLSLESYALPCGIAPALEDIRGNTDSPNRFADQTCGLVVYADGRAGVTVDHTVADCATGFELSKWLSQLAAAAPTPTAPAQYKPPTMLRFPRLRGGPTPTKYQDSVLRLVNTLTFPLPRGVVEKGLIDFLISLALQSAVGEGVAITQSVFQRGVVNARTELVMMVTLESTEFLAAKTPKALANAWEARNLRIKSRTFPFYLSTFLAPALSCLPESPAMETVQKVVEIASGDKAEVQLTGFTVDYHYLDGVEAGLSNIYLPHQLSVFYLAKPGQGGYGEVEIAFSATGRWREKLEDVVDGFSRAWEDVVNVALSG